MGGCPWLRTSYTMQRSPRDGLMPLARGCILKRWEGSSDGCGEGPSLNKKIRDDGLMKNDTFSRLCAKGVVMDILCYLPDKSVAALRRASRSGNRTPFLQMFRQSRFWTCNDFRLFTEAWQADRERATDEYIDWRRLYDTVWDPAT